MFSVAWKRKLESSRRTRAEITKVNKLPSHETFGSEVAELPPEWQREGNFQHARSLYKRQ